MLSPFSSLAFPIKFYVIEFIQYVKKYIIYKTGHIYKREKAYILLQCIKSLASAEKES